MTQISGPVLPTKIFAESKVLKKGDQQIPTDLHMTHTGRCNVYMARVNWNSRFSVMAVQNPTPAALVRSRAWEHPLIFPVLFQAVIWNPYCAGGGKSLHGPEVWESIAMPHINNLVVKSEVFQRRLVRFEKKPWLSWLVGWYLHISHSES